MKVLCPECQSSIELSRGETALECTSCGLNIDISKLGTSPGMAPIPVVRDFTGESLGEYRLEELIGIGGMGVVYRAVRISDDSEVAVKILTSEVEWKREAFVARFKREAEALKRLDHPNVVRLIDSGEEGDCYYLVTEYVEGQNLAGYLRSQTLTINRVVEIMTQVCEAITYAHANGIVHRDIKPANIVVSKDRVKVLDFGLAQITGKDTGLTTLTRTDLAMGTINYLSPEQRLNAKNVDERSDIFSLGIVFFEMLTGTLPLGTFEPPSKFRKDAPKRCNHIVNRSLNTNPDLRYQNVEALRVDLLRVIGPPLVSKPLAFAAVALLSILVGGFVARTYVPPKALEIQQTELDSNVNVHSANQDEQVDKSQPEMKQMDNGPANSDVQQLSSPIDSRPEQKVEEPAEEPAEEAPKEQINRPSPKDNKSGIKSRKPSIRSQKPRVLSEKERAYLERRQVLKDKKMGKKKPEVKPSADKKSNEKISPLLEPETDAPGEVANDIAVESYLRTSNQDKKESKKSRLKEKKRKGKNPKAQDDTNIVDDFLSNQSSK